MDGPNPLHTNWCRIFLVHPQYEWFDATLRRLLSKESDRSPSVRLRFFWWGLFPQNSQKEVTKKWRQRKTFPVGLGGGGGGVGEFNQLVLLKGKPKGGCLHKIGVVPRSTPINRGGTLGQTILVLFHVLKICLLISPGWL